MPQSYTPIHDSIPEEDWQFSSDDESAYRLRQIDRATSSSQAAKEYDAARKSADYEAYLDTLTSDEQHLLSASNDHDIDDLDLYGSGKAAERRKLAEARKRKAALAQRGGWRSVYYSKAWWLTLVVVILALALLVGGFLKYTWSKGDTWEDYVRCDRIRSFGGDVLGVKLTVLHRICPGRTHISLRPREGRSRNGPIAMKKLRSSFSR
jgi:beta-glucosidase